MSSTTSPFGLSFIKSSRKPAPSKICKFEIWPDAEYIMFRGRPGDTESQKVSGRAVLMTSEPIDAKSVKISFVGTRRTSHQISNTDLNAGFKYVENGYIRGKHEFLRQEERLRSSPSRLVEGNYEFPFEFELPGDACESIEGFSELPKIHYQVYELHAVIERKGFGVKDLTASKHVRVIRTIGSGVEELLDPEGVSGHWVDKIMYEWSICSKSLVYGDKVSVDFALTPLVDKLRIGRIKFWIREIVHVKTVPGWQDYPDQPTNMWEEVYKAGEQSTDPPDEVPVNLHPELLLPQKKFSLTFDLPKSLTECRQSVDQGEWILVRHRLHITIILHNPDGHKSELRANLPVRLYISPHLPIGENNTVSASPPNMSTSNLHAETAATPPTYQDHMRDTPLNPFRDIDPSGFVTPAILGSRSGSATPRHPFGRSGSVEQGPALAGVSSQQAPTPDELAARLQNLQSLSRIVEEHEPEPGPQHIEHIDYDMDRLERITSYNTAVRTPGPRNYSNLPPTYEDATSRPPSPQSGAQT